MQDDGRGSKFHTNGVKRIIVLNLLLVHILHLMHVLNTHLDTVLGFFFLSMNSSVYSFACRLKTILVKDASLLTSAWPLAEFETRGLY